tara:strand:+ start:76 stop:681 length:606 start_codon:yes stop_codon:yes gene_type:complete
MKKILVLGTIIIALLGFSKKKSQKHIGTYVYDEFYGVYSQITLDTNQSFTYQWQAGLNNGITKGKYKIKGNSLILNSEFKNKLVIDSSRTNQKKIELELIQNNGKPIEFAYYKLGGKESLTERNGKIFLPETFNDSITIMYHLGDNVTLKRNWNKEFKYKITIPQPPAYYRYFTSEIWKIKRNKIYVGSRYKIKYKKIKSP